jgi:hypothetical protein
MEETGEYTCRRGPRGDDDWTSAVHYLQGVEWVGGDLSTTLREQMLMELMTPASVAAATMALIASLHENPGPDHEGATVAFADESRVWR